MWRWKKQKMPQRNNHAHGCVPISDQCLQCPGYPSFSDPYYSLLQYISHTRNRLKRLVVQFSLCTEEIEVQIVEGTFLYYVFLPLVPGLLIRTLPVVPGVQNVRSKLGPVQSLIIPSSGFLFSLLCFCLPQKCENGLSLAFNHLINSGSTIHISFWAFSEAILE